MLDHFPWKISQEFDYSFYPLVNDWSSSISVQDGYQMMVGAVPRDDPDLDRKSYCDCFHAAAAAVAVDGVYLVSKVMRYSMKEIHHYYYWRKDVVEGAILRLRVVREMELDQDWWQYASVRRLLKVVERRLWEFERSD